MNSDLIHIFLTALQWPAMVTTLAAAWLVGSKDKVLRRRGFWWFIASNILWSIWGLYTDGYALIVLQLGLFILNIRGAHKNESTKNKKLI